MVAQLDFPSRSRPAHSSRREGSSGFSSRFQRSTIDPYGKVTVLAPDGQTTRTASLYGNPWTFTGRRLDQETGLMYFRNRMYDVGLGRFCQRDPWGENNLLPQAMDGYPNGLNTYAAYYVPNTSDPKGLKVELTVKTISGPDPGNCGEVEWVVQFVLTGSSPSGGWVVQEIKHESEVKDCNGKKIRETKRHFWEAWQIGPSHSITTDAVHGYPDDDYYRFLDQGVCTKGKLEIKAKVRFYEGLALPKSFVMNNTDTIAGVLPSTTTDPKLKGGTSSVNHNLKVKWNCCPNDVRKTEIQDHEP